MMEAFHVLLMIGVIHLSIFFFNTIFVSCVHLPYLTLLKKFGLDIQFLRIKWFTTKFNRSLMKWGLNHSKFWSLWYNIGLLITIILLPIVVIVFLKIAVDDWSNNSITNNKNEELLEVMIPGVDIPYKDLAYYVFSLLLCSIVHELGHAMAAVKEDVRFYGLGMIIFFIIPVAYVNLNEEQLKSLPIKNRLRILCAGVWHNIILAIFSTMILGTIIFIFSPFFVKNSGIFIKDIHEKSPLLGPSGLKPGDVVYGVNDCIIKNSTNWKTCILQAAKTSTPGYCVTDIMVKELDKSFSDKNDNIGDQDCCDQHNLDKGYFCFEHLGGFDIQTSRSFPHLCLPTRVIVESSHNSCQSNDQCIMLNDLCVRPLLDNMTKIVQIQRYKYKDVLFFGNPTEIYYTTELSDWIPRFSFLSPNFPEAIILLCKYITVFSLGLAVINLVPCFYFDGEHIVSILIDTLLRNKMSSQSFRKKLAVTIKMIFTIILIVHCLKLFSKKI